jgi:hypothetical protein
MQSARASNYACPEVICTSGRKDAADPCDGQGLSAAEINFGALGQRLRGRGFDPEPQVDSIHLNHPFIRNTSGNLYGQLQFDPKQLHDDVGLASIRTNRHTNEIVAVLAGEAQGRDEHYNLTLSRLHSWIRMMGFPSLSQVNSPARISLATAAISLGGN